MNSRRHEPAAQPMHDRCSHNTINHRTVRLTLQLIMIKKIGAFDNKWADSGRGFSCVSPP